jgi:hypothetical protein
MILKPISVLSLLFLLGLSKTNLNDKPCVADANQAIGIAEKEFIKVYGEKKVNEEKPFVAKLVKDTIWIVRGSLPKNDNRGHWVGGVALAEINANNCKIIKIIHGK